MHIGALRSWLLTQSIPLWLRHGVDHAQGAFHEELSPHTFISGARFRRLRVAARQTYVFARAHEVGVPGADVAVALGIDFLRHRAALPGGGYASCFDLAGNPTDTTRDLYDQAFVLLALAAASAVLPRARLHEEALRLLGFLDTELAHPAGGYHEGLPARLPRRQNPHMHLLEAVLAAHAAFGDPVFLDRAHGLVALCLRHFVAPETGALLEWLSDDLRPLDDNVRPLAAAGCFAAEPGHGCEWVWLLHEYQKVAGVSHDAEAGAAALMRFVDRHGAHPDTGDVMDAVWSDGRPDLRTARLWPQTERLKAEHVRRDGTATGLAHAASRLATWLRPDGLWVERRDALGADVDGAVPASSLYHLACGILAVSGRPGTLPLDPVKQRRASHDGA